MDDIRWKLNQERLLISYQQNLCFFPYNFDSRGCSTTATPQGAPLHINICFCVHNLYYFAPMVCLLIICVSAGFVRRVRKISRKKTKISFVRAVCLSVYPSACSTLSVFIEIMSIKFYFYSIPVRINFLYVQPYGQLSYLFQFFLEWDVFQIDL